MILNATTKKLQVILGEAKTTTDCAVVADYYDSGTSPAGAAQTTLTNGTTAVDVVSSPASGYTRIINGMTVENDDTVSHTVTVRFYDNGTTYKIIKATLAPGYTLTFTKSYGWAVLSPTGLFVAGQIPGTATNDSAAAGMIGEYISLSVLSGAPTALVNNTAKDLGSISLTPGDWDVSAGVGYLDPTGVNNTTVNVILGSISTTSATKDFTVGRFANQTYNALTIFSLDTFAVFPIGETRFTLSATTTVYLVAQAGFAVGSCSAFGTIRARRAR